MKKGCFVVLALLMLSASALADVVVTVNVKSLTKQPVTDRVFVQFDLKNCTSSPVVPDGVLDLFRYTQYAPDATGNVTATLYRNDNQVSCDGAYVSLTTVSVISNGKKVWTKDYKFQDANADLATYAPFTSNPPSPPGAVIVGSLASRPSPSSVGRFYCVNDTGDMRCTRDNGLTWIDTKYSWNWLDSKPSTFPPSAHTHAESEVTNLTTDLAAKEVAANKAQPNGYASLDSGSNVVQNALTATKVPPRNRGNINVLDDCGLIGDGTTDDTAAMNSCLATYQGRHIILPRTSAYGSATHQYRFASTLFPKGVGTEISCEAGGSQFNGNAGPVRLHWDAGTPGVVVDNNTNFAQALSWHGCWFDGSEGWNWAVLATFQKPYGYPGGTSQSDGIRAYGGKVNLYDNVFTHWGRDGVRIDTAYYTGNANNCSIRNNYFGFNRGSGLFLIGIDTNNCNIADNDFTENQFHGLIDHTFLGNHVSGGHAVLNHQDGTGGPGAATWVVTKTACSMTNGSAVVSCTDGDFGYWRDPLLIATVNGAAAAGGNLVSQIVSLATCVLTSITRVGTTATATCVGHGFVAGEKLLHTGTLDANYNGEQTVATVVDADHYTFTLAASAGGSTTTGTAFGSRRLTLATPASTTVGPTTMTYTLDGRPYKAVGTAQSSGDWKDLYCEGGQMPAQFAQQKVVYGGNLSACGVDTSPGGVNVRSTSNGYTITSHYGIRFDTGLEDIGINVVYQPGVSTQQTMNEQHRKYDGTLQWTGAWNGDFSLKNNVLNKFVWANYAAGGVDWSPTANGQPFRVCRQPYGGAGVTGCSFQVCDGTTTCNMTVDANGKGTFNGGLLVNTTAAKPTCAVGIRGQFWVTQSTTGVKDLVEVCAKDAADAYAWRPIY